LVSVGLGSVGHELGWRAWRGLDRDCGVRVAVEVVGAGHTARQIRGQFDGPSGEEPYPQHAGIYLKARETGSVVPDYEADTQLTMTDA